MHSRPLLKVVRGPRTLRAKFLAISVPIALVATLACYLVFERSAQFDARDTLALKLQRLADSQQQLLSQPLRNGEHPRVRLALEALASDPDVTSAAVYDDAGKQVAAVGTEPISTAGLLVTDRTIIFDALGEQRPVGRLVLELSTARSIEQTRSQRVLAGTLLAAVLLTGIIAALIAYSRTIGRPVERMLEAIASTEPSASTATIEWQSDDEIGRVVDAFNEMQARRARYESELRAARVQLEQRVAQRTAELGEKTALLETTLENIDQGIAMIDPAQRLVSFNRRVCELLDLPPSLLETRPPLVEVLRFQQDHGEFKGLDDQKRAILSREMSGSSSGTAHYERTRPDGSVLEVRTKPLRDGGWVRTYTDVTERASATTALQRASEQAQAANAAKSAFLANMSHELRTPLNAVIGLTELALDTELDATQRSYLSKSKVAGDTLLRLIDDILDFSKMEAGKLDFESVEFDLDDLLRSTVDVVGLPAREKGLALELDAAADVPRRLVGDPARLGQVLSNLLGNAIKFTEEGTVSLALRVLALADGHVTLEWQVRDTGIGLTDAQRARLFQVFTQADESTTRRYGGTGLGLAICKSLVERMHGRIQLDSEHGVGTVVTFTTVLGYVLTTAARLAAVERRDASAATDARVLRLDGVRVLVAEDHAINQEVAEGILRAAGVDVVCVADGREAVERVAAHPAGYFDAVLMDLQMPTMDGLEATRVLRAEYGDALPVIAMTAHASASERARCLAAGMNDHVAKPVRPARLVATLSQWVSARQKPAPVAAPAEAPAACWLPAPEGIDLTTARRNLADNHAAWLRILARLPGELRDTVNALDGRDDDDLHALERAAHGIRGVAAFIGAQRVAEAAERTETLAREGQQEAAEAAEQSLRRAAQDLLAAVEASPPPAPATH